MTPIEIRKLLKRFSAVFLVNVMLLTCGEALTWAIDKSNAVITEYASTYSEDMLWEILQENSPNDYVAAGILGFFWRESVYKSDAVAHWPHDVAYYGEDPGEEFTQMLDSADRKEFITLIQNHGGYGLGQWYSKKHLESFYDFCKGYGSSFGDATMQCLFAIHGCVNDPVVWEHLQDARNAHDAGKIIASLYDGTTSGGGTIAAKAKMIYKERVRDHVR